MKKVILIFSVILQLAFVYSQKVDNNYSPEKLSTSFVSYLKIGDISNILKLCAYNNDDIVNKIDPKEFLKRLGALTPGNYEGLPANFNLLKKIRLLSAISYQINKLYCVLLLPEDFSDYINDSTVRLENDDIINEYYDSLNISKLADIKIIRVDEFMPEVQKSDRRVAFLGSLKKVYKFDEKKECTVLYELNQNYYIGGLTFVRYGQEWYIESLKCELASIINPEKLENKKEYFEKTEIEE